MARKIEWTATSILDRCEIYQFWNDKNKSDAYSKKLDSLFNEVAKLVSEYPQIGTATDLPGLRVKVIKSYKLFYFDDSETIRIIRIWDSRQNPRRINS